MWRCRSASDCPIEWITQILSQLTPDERLTCRSVCKKWFIAAKHSLEDQEELVLSFDKMSIRKEFDLRNAVYFVKHLHEDTTDIDPHVGKLLSHFKYLKKLTVVNDLIPCGYEWFECDEFLYRAAHLMLKSMISSNSQSLTVLNIPETHLVKDQSPVFPELRELRCSSLTMDDCSMIPKLRKLTVLYTASLQHLPNEMQELVMASTSITWTSAPTEEQEIDYLLLVVSRLVNLKVLRIGSSSRFQFPDEKNFFKKKLIQNLKYLQRLSLRFTTKENPACDDELMAHLVEKNSHLMEINCMNLTEKGVELLSSLKGLRIATDLRLESPDQMIPMVMKILTGDSQGCIQKVSVRVKKGQADLFLMSKLSLQNDALEQLYESGLRFKVASNWKGHALLVIRESDPHLMSPSIYYNSNSNMTDDHFFNSHFA